MKNLFFTLVSCLLFMNFSSSTKVKNTNEFESQSEAMFVSSSCGEFYDYLLEQNDNSLVYWVNLVYDSYGGQPDLLDFIWETHLDREKEIKAEKEALCK